MIGSAGIDWCEPNYRYTGYVAELFNTLSSGPLIIFPLFGLYLHNPYFKYINPTARWVYYFALVVGVTSCYYHATLTLVGQLLDELSLLWVMIVGYCVWLPFMRLTESWRQYSGQAVRGLLLSAVIGSFLVFLEPSINAYLLMVFVLPIILCLGTEVRLANNARASGIGLFCVGTWSVAVSVWISDRTMCGFWQSAGFPYLHAFWHVLSALSAYVLCVIFSYLDASSRASKLLPIIAYFPANWFVGLPYVRLDGVF